MWAAIVNSILVAPFIVLDHFRRKVREFFCNNWVGCGGQLHDQPGHQILTFVICFMGLDGKFFKTPINTRKQVINHIEQATDIIKGISLSLLRASPKP